LYRYAGDEDKPQRQVSNAKKIKHTHKSTQLNENHLRLEMQRRSAHKSGPEDPLPKHLFWRDRSSLERSEAVLDFFVQRNGPCSSAMEGIVNRHI